jgi:hypothetical protein
MRTLHKVLIGITVGSLVVSTVVAGMYYNQIRDVGAPASTATFYLDESASLASTPMFSPTPDQAQLITPQVTTTVEIPSLVEDRPGPNGSQIETFHTMLRAFLDPGLHASQRIKIDGEELLTVPWFANSTHAAVDTLNSGSGDFAITPELGSHYLMVSDELSELAFAMSLGRDEKAMMDMSRTIDILTKAGNHDLPIWIAEVDSGKIIPKSQDSAEDASARFGLAYLQAARNTNFSEEARDIFLLKGLDLVENHLQNEYVHTDLKSPSGRTLDHIVTSGGNVADGGVDGARMYIGYFPDSIKVMLAAAAATDDPEKKRLYEDVASQVTEQFLIASRFDGMDLSFGLTNFTWQVQNNTLGIGPADDYFWNKDNPAFDSFDAPRALAMGDVLRVADIYFEGDLPEEYLQLKKWVDLAKDPAFSDGKAYIQFFQDGRAFPASGSSNYYNMSLVAGLFSQDRNNPVFNRLVSESLNQIHESGIAQDADYPGIFKSIRVARAIISSTNLDSPTYVPMLDVIVDDTLGLFPTLAATSMPQAAFTPDELTLAARPASEVEISDGNFIYYFVEALPMEGMLNGKPLDIVYMSRTYMPLYTKGNDPSGIIPDKDTPIRTGKVVVFYIPDVDPAKIGQTVSFAMWADGGQHTQSTLKVYNQLNGSGNYDTHGVELYVTGMLVQDNDIFPGFFPRITDSSPQVTDEVRPDNPLMP